MVRIRDDGVFDAPIDRVWKYVNDESAHTHGSFQVTKVLEQKGNAMVAEAKLANADGTFNTEKIRMVMNPPKGFDFEYLSGPMKGSKHTHTYTPMGSKTRVDVDGDFVVPPGATEAAVRKSALDYFAMVFDEDNTRLRKYK